MLIKLFNDKTDSIAVRAPSKEPMNFTGLCDQIIYTNSTLNNIGVGRNDRVAIVLPNGPHAATAFLSVASGASAAPLNPSYKKDEFEFYMDDLEVKCLLIDEGSNSTAIEAAQKLNIPVLWLVADESIAGKFSLNTEQMPENPLGNESGFNGDDDEALVLHTSGTTGRPKIVPLSLKNVLASARNIGNTLSLTSEDKGVGIMALFHIHGLMASVTAPLAAGGSVYYTPGFNARHIIDWMDEAQPTWYTGVPTMHQGLLTQASKEKNRPIVEGFAKNIRFVRSASAALPPSVLAELEALFPNAVVVESYAMTEACHQMTSNPVDRARRKPGTVGIAAGPDVRIMDPLSENLLPAGEEGDIVIRGENVTAGYHNNPEANAKDFTSNGWFRTGDTGVMDDEGYLKLVARTKEIINRGGEKIAPVEVDNAISEHPAVAQVATFSIPDQKWGEIVGAAVVLREGESIEPTELQKYVREKLADFKVPSEVVFVDEIPKGPTGKLQRIGLHRSLGFPDLPA